MERALLRLAYWEVVMWGRRARSRFAECALAAALVGLCVPGCTGPHVDLQLQLACDPGQSKSPVPAGCSGMMLGCANFLEARLYEWRGDSLGDILASSCEPTSALGYPADLCALEARGKPLPILSNLPTGKTVRFRLRALHVDRPADGCNVDVFVSPLNQVVFDGFSAPLKVDAADHRVPMSLSTCGSCTDKQVTSASMGCQQDAGTCLAAGQPCAGGGVAQTVAGGCCAACTGF
jgi:hypothetical protein